jgi:murein L,D-transpeptidase YcbB/YkuD
VRVALSAAIFCLITCRGDATSSQEPSGRDGEFRAAISTAVATSDSSARVPRTAGRNELRALYEPSAYAPLWIEGAGRPTRDADEALALLRNSFSEGLDPADYDAAPLDRLARTLTTERRARAEDVGAFEAGLSAGMLRYFRNLHLGRVDPRAAGFRVTIPADEHDFAAILGSALAVHDVAGAAAGLTPPLALYRGLRTMLARYRALGTNQANDVLPSLAATARRGDIHPEIPTLRRRLIALGDLPEEAPIVPLLFDDALVEGVKRFQARHGLQADGVVGKSTLAALAVPIATRTRQIELALERLRWLPHLGDQRLLAVNIPMFRMWAWDAIPPDDAPLFGMDVIVGRALDRQTPVFVEEISEVVFRPFWNVPSSILRNEVLPALARNPDYLERENMEIVAGPGDDARAVPSTAENIARLEAGGLRVRQRPGPRNALGLVKFVFPNEANIYMHATPAPQLFSRARRDFSHGCVRVEDPVRLAEWVLKDQPEWTRDTILAAMHGRNSTRVALPQPIQVILFYITAVAAPEDGKVYFSQDIYGHDARLERALRQSR